MRIVFSHSNVREDVTEKHYRQMFDAWNFIHFHDELVVNLKVPVHKNSYPAIIRIDVDYENGLYKTPEGAVFDKMEIFLK